VSRTTTASLRESDEATSGPAGDLDLLRRYYANAMGEDLQLVQQSRVEVNKKDAEQEDEEARCKPKRRRKEKKDSASCSSDESKTKKPRVWLLRTVEDLRSFCELYPDVGDSDKIKQLNSSGASAGESGDALNKDGSSIAPGELFDEHLEQADIA
ncbi:unnamed protein product, partial [Amoebophrya sp. A25]